MKKIAIIPAYNEQQNILNTIDDLRRNAPDMDYIIIDDCSTDATRSICADAGLNYISLPHNLGIGGGVQTGYIYARDHGYDIAVQFDGDGQHMARYIAPLIAPIIDGAADLTIGSRFISGGGFQSSAMRRFGIRFLSRLIRLLGHVRILDVTSGMRAANRGMIEYFSREYAQDFPEPEAILAASMHGARICEVPVQMRDRQGGVSSIRAWGSVYYMIKVSLALLLQRIAK